MASLRWPSGASSVALLLAVCIASSRPYLAAGYSCSWLGHCLGAACKTYNDCDGDLICNSGKCGPDPELPPSTPPPSPSTSPSPSPTRPTPPRPSTLPSPSAAPALTAGQVKSKVAEPIGLCGSGVNIKCPDTKCCSSQGRCGVGTDHCSPGKCDPMWGVCSAASAPQPGPSSQTDPKTIVGIVSGILVGIGAIVAMAYTAWKWWHKHKARKVFKRASNRARSQGLPAPPPPLGVPRVKDVTPGGHLWSWFKSNKFQQDAVPAASAVGHPQSVNDKATGNTQNVAAEEDV